jgi:hypothetical protein
VGGVSCLLFRNKGDLTPIRIGVTYLSLLNSGQRILFFSRMDVHGYNVVFKNTKKFMSVFCMFVTLTKKSSFGLWRH